MQTTEQRHAQKASLLINKQSIWIHHHDDPDVEKAILGALSAKMQAIFKPIFNAINERQSNQVWEQMLPQHDVIGGTLMLHWRLRNLHSSVIHREFTAHAQRGCPYIVIDGVHHYNDLKNLQTRVPAQLERML